jgi:hypothetical protein
VAPSTVTDTSTITQVTQGPNRPFFPRPGQ